MVWGGFTTPRAKRGCLAWDDQGSAESKLRSGKLILKRGGYAESTTFLRHARQPEGTSAAGGGKEELAKTLQRVGKGGTGARDATAVRNFSSQSLRRDERARLRAARKLSSEKSALLDMEGGKGQGAAFGDGSTAFDETDRRQGLPACPYTSPKKFTKEGLKKDEGKAGRARPCPVVVQCVFSFSARAEIDVEERKGSGEKELEA